MLTLFWYVFFLIYRPNIYSIFYNEQGFNTNRPEKDEMPGMDSDLGVFDAIYCEVVCEAGSKTIGIKIHISGLL